MTQFNARPSLEQTEIVRLLRGIKFELRGIKCELKRMNGDKADKAQEEETENENPS